MHDYLPRMLSCTREEYPRPRLLLSEQKTTTLIGRLLVGALDAALLALPATADGLTTTPLFFEPFSLACPAGHCLENLPSLRLQDLEGDDLLLLEEGHCLRDQALSLCPPQPNLRTRHTTSLETPWHMIAAGEGYSLLPLLSLRGRDAVAGLVASRPFEDPTVGRTIGLAWRASDPRDPEFRQLAEFLRRDLPDGVRA